MTPTNTRNMLPEPILAERRAQFWQTVGKALFLAFGVWALWMALK